MAAATGDPDRARRLTDLLEGDDRLTFVGVAADSDEAVALVGRERPVVLVAAIGLPPDGLAAVLPALLAADEHLCVLAVVDTPHASGWLEALRQGAVGIVRTPDDTTPPRALGDDVLATLHGETVLAPPAGRAVLRELRQPAAPPKGLKPYESILTNREWQVLDLIEDGCTTVEIAARLVLSEETVYTHVTNILRKLGVHTRADAVAARAAMRAGSTGARPE